jgi:phage terminase small subunit
MRGRPRKSRSEHFLNGTFRLDRHGDSDQVFIAPGTPARPKNIGPYAEEFWDTIVADLSARKLVARIDSVELRELAVWYGRYRRAAVAYDKAGPSSKNSKKLLSATTTCWQQFATLAARFGLNPADRSRLRVEPSLLDQIEPLESQARRRG